TNRFSSPKWPQVLASPGSVSIKVAAQEISATRIPGFMRTVLRLVSLRAPAGAERADLGNRSSLGNLRPEARVCQLNSRQRELRGPGPSWYNHYIPNSPRKTRRASTPRRGSGSFRGLSLITLNLGLGERRLQY